MTCIPPPGTKPGTLCILRRDLRTCVGEWDGQAYLFLRPNPDVPHGTLTDYHIPRDDGCRCGWVFAGVMPEAPRPQTAQGVAREAWAKVPEAYRTGARHWVGDAISALERIAEMPESP